MGWGVETIGRQKSHINLINSLEDMGLFFFYIVTLTSDKSGDMTLIYCEFFITSVQDRMVMGELVVLCCLIDRNFLILLFFFFVFLLTFVGQGLGWEMLLGDFIGSCFGLS